jgi:hypothetical protein
MAEASNSKNATPEISQALQVICVKSGWNGMKRGKSDLYTNPKTFSGNEINGLKDNVSKDNELKQKIQSVMNFIRPMGSSVSLSGSDPFAQLAAGKYIINGVQMLPNSKPDENTVDVQIEKINMGNNNVQLEFTINPSGNEDKKAFFGGKRSKRKKSRSKSVKKKSKSKKRSRSRKSKKKSN